MMIVKHGNAALVVDDDIASMLGLKTGRQVTNEGAFYIAHMSLTKCQENMRQDAADQPRRKS